MEHASEAWGLGSHDVSPFATSQKRFLAICSFTPWHPGPCLVSSLSLGSAAVFSEKELAVHYLWHLRVGHGGSHPHSRLAAPWHGYWVASLSLHFGEGKPFAHPPPIQVQSTAQCRGLKMFENHLYAMGCMADA